MGDKSLEEKVESAIGNVEVEGYNISEKEKELILRTFKKYQDRLGDNAINSLLYGLANEIEHEEKNANKR